MACLFRTVAEGGTILTARVTLGDEQVNRFAQQLSDDQLAALAERHPRQAASIIAAKQD